MIDVKGKSIFLSGPMSMVPNYNVAAFAETMVAKACGIPCHELEEVFA